MHLKKKGESFKIVFCMFSCKFRHLPNANGAHMYAPRMAMDPRFGYPTHIPRHGNPSLSHIPHNFTMQVCQLGCDIKLKLMTVLLGRGGSTILHLLLCHNDFFQHLHLIMPSSSY